MNNAGSNNMNIRRFVGENSRAALRQVREALGGDAIILANRTIQGGVEVLAAAPEAVDALTRRMTASPAPSTNPTPTPTELGLKAAADAVPPPAVGIKRLASLFGRRTQAAPDAPLPTMVDQIEPPSTTAAKAASSYLSFADELVAADTDDDFVTRIAPEAVALSRPTTVAAEAVVPRPAATPIVDQKPEVAKAAETPARSSEPVITAAELSDVVAREVSREISREFGRDVINDLTHDVSREVSMAVTGEVAREVSSSVTAQVTREFRAMQATLIEQLSTLTWTDSMRRQPVRTKLMQDLILAGFSPALSRHIQARLPDDYAAEQAATWVREILKRNLPVASDAEELIHEGGVFALVGPTGVGKTTTVAKLAARFALKHGVDRLALITTDGFRIGAQDQLRIYGKILGVAVHSIHDEASLTSSIRHLVDKKLVLIDTAGLGQRDERVAAQIAMLHGAKAKRLVVLNATSDAETLDHVVTAYADRDFAGCVVTKTDEASRLGPVLDTVIRHRLKIHHVSTGQKVPEDLERPDASALIDTALHREGPHPAFDLMTDEVPTWMSAMAARAGSLDASLLNTGNVHA